MSGTSMAVFPYFLLQTLKIFFVHLSFYCLLKRPISTHKDIWAWVSSFRSAVGLAETIHFSQWGSILHFVHTQPPAPLQKILFKISAKLLGHVCVGGFLCCSKFHVWCTDFPWMDTNVALVPLGWIRMIFFFLVHSKVRNFSSWGLMHEGVLFVWSLLCSLHLVPPTSAKSRLLFLMQLIWVLSISSYHLFQVNWISREVSRVWGHCKFVILIKEAVDVGILPESHKIVVFFFICDWLWKLLIRSLDWST